MTERDDSSACTDEALAYSPITLYLDVAFVKRKSFICICQGISKALGAKIGKTAIAIVCSHSGIRLYRLCVKCNGLLIVFLYKKKKKYSIKL